MDLSILMSSLPKRRNNNFYGPTSVRGSSIGQFLELPTASEPNNFYFLKMPFPHYLLHQFQPMLTIA
jgi:hypothetical protein